jgi:hypothetical protein
MFLYAFCEFRVVRRGLGAGTAAAYRARITTDTPWKG